MTRTRDKTAALLLAAAVLSGCSAAPAAARAAGDDSYTPANEIISYKPIDTDKTVITVGKYLAVNTDPLEEALEARFPGVDFVFTEPDAGSNDVAYMQLKADGGKLEDIQLTTHVVNEENSFLYDLSGESFTSRYNLSALDSMNIKGKLYQLPLSSGVYGIAYNKTLFEAHGWTAPDTLEAFYSLCDTIEAAHVRSFVPCFKYYTVIESVAFGLSYDDVFASAENQVKYQAFYNRTGSCKNLLEPAFRAVKGLYERGYVTGDDFNSSATELRHALYSGDVAMMPSNVSIFSFAEQEKPDCKIGFIGFPTGEPGARRMQMVPGNLLSVSARSMEDAAKRSVLLDVLGYISSGDGQDALLKCFSGVSSLAAYQQNIEALPQEVRECLTDGRVFFADYYASNDFVPQWKEYAAGRMSLDEFVAANDAIQPTDYFAPLHSAPIGTASDDFTVLETSICIADTMREAAHTDAALILNGCFYTGNLAQIFKGDIVLPERFSLKSMGAKSYLTAYKITGANLKELMEHPIVNGAPVNAMYACAGLKMKYAPWADSNQNVVSLTLADGTPIDEAKLYTVAAWPGSIAQQYITAVEAEFPFAGTNKELMSAAIRRAGTIAPVRDGRITLLWNEPTRRS